MVSLDYDIGFVENPRGLDDFMAKHGFMRELGDVAYTKGTIDAYFSDDESVRQFWKSMHGIEVAASMGIVSKEIEDDYQEMNRLCDEILETYHSYWDDGQQLWNSVGEPTRQS